MFELQIAVVLIGLLGTVMVFYFSPSVDSRTFLYQRDEINKIQKRDKKKRFLSKIGLFITILSFILQLGILIKQNIK